jgi:hypothetical protein
MAIQKQEHVSSIWFTWVYINETHSEMLITNHKVSEEEASAYQQAYLEQHQYDDVQPVTLDLYADKELLKDMVLYIKNNQPTWTQWLKYLAKLRWDDVYMLRFWLAKLALILAERNEIEITDFSELQVLSKLKTYIKDQPLRKLNRLLFGE